MSYSYEYDESGFASSYLALSILAPIALYYTYSMITRRFIKRIECSCPGCQRKNPDGQGKSKIAAMALWIVISYLVYNVRTLKVENKKGFNPLEILGIEHNTGIKDIKKRLRVLLMKYNVNKVAPGLKAQYAEKQKLVNKAYGLVSNKEKYESWLNNESKAGEIVAIPKVIVQKGILAFLVYSMVLGVLLPRWAYGKWRGVRDKNRVGVSFKTMEMFYSRIDDNMNQRKCFLEASIKLISLMSRSVEFRDHAWKSNVEGLKIKIESNFAFPLKDFGEVNKGYLVLMDHLFRIHQVEPSDAEYVQKVSILLIEGMKAIAFAKRYGNLVKQLVVLEAMIVQAVFDPRYFMLQIPFVEFEDLFMQEKRNRREAPGEDYLTSTLGGVKLKSAMAIYSHIPRVEITEFSASVINTGQEMDGDDVQDLDEDDVIVKTQASETNDKGKKAEQTSYLVPEKSMVTVTVTLKKTYARPDLVRKDARLAVHAPYINGTLLTKWIVMLTMDDKICAKTQFLDDFEENTMARFNVEASGLKKTSECRVFVGCGEYLNVNVEKSMILKVE